ncbi:MAG: DUF998 domain-containing protein [Candidatus Njordarchaeales archaeon]
MKNLKIFYYFAILTPIVAYTFIFIAIAKTPEFSWIHNALSDLGGPLGIRYGANIIFNSGLIISGILFFISLIGIMKDFETIVEKIGVFILLLSAVFLFLIGLFPETAGRIHYYVSVGFFVTFPIGMGIISGSNILRRKDILLGIYGIFVFIACLIIWIFPWKNYGVIGVAIPEFLSSLTGSIWVIILAIKRLLETS